MLCLLTMFCYQFFHQMQKATSYNSFVVCFWTDFRLRVMYLWIYWFFSGFFAEKIINTPESGFLIICQDRCVVDTIKEDLKRANVTLNCVLSNENGGKRALSFTNLLIIQMSSFTIECHHFFYHGKNVYFCVARTLPSLDLKNISHFIIYNVFMSAENREEIQYLSKKFESKIKPVSSICYRGSLCHRCSS